MKTILLILSFTYSICALAVVPDASITTAKIADKAVTFTKRSVRSTSSTASVGNVALSGDTGTSSATYTGSASPSYASITALRVTLTTNGGPVLIGLVGINYINVVNASYLDAESNSILWVRIVRDDLVVVFETQFSSATGAIFHYSPGMINSIDNGVIAGTHTYQVQAQCSNSGGYCGLINVRLMAYEM